MGHARRAVVTGLGVIAPCGQSLDAFWAAITAPLDAPPAGSPDAIAGFEPGSWLGRADVNRTDDRIHYAVAAAALAFADAGEPTFEPRRAGVIIAVFRHCGHGGFAGRWRVFDAAPVA